MDPATTARAARWRLARSLGALVAALAAIAALAAPAAALPVDVFFDGNPTTADPNTNFGISEATAFALRDDPSFGFQIHDAANFAYVGSPVGALAVVNQNLTSATVNPSTGPSRATSSWTLENTSGGALSGASYLLFTQSDPFTVSGVNIDYLDSNVGITIDSAAGWSIVRTLTSDGAFYFPALLLDQGPADPLQGSIAAGVFPTPITVNYVLRNELLQDAPVGSMEWQLPELGIGYALQPIPEPGSAALLALGLVGIARRARKPSVR